MNYPKNDVLNNLLTNIKKESHNRIYADLSGFTPPYSIGLSKKNPKGYQPDIIIEKKDATDIISVETKIKKRVTKKDIERWNLLRTYAKLKKGNLFLAGDALCISLIKNKLESVPDNLKFIHLV